MKRDTCPECGGEAEFVQFGGEESSVAVTEPSEVGDGLLELRVCTDCGAGVESVLTVESQKTLVQD